MKNRSAAWGGSPKCPLPLHVESLYNEYDFVGAFAVATLLTGLGLLTLLAKSLLEWRFAGEIAATRRH